MPWRESLQIVLGLLIPIMLVGHVSGTRLAADIAGVDDSYLNVLRYLWPSNALFQIAALLVVWCHGCLGIYFAFHFHRWFTKLRHVLAALAVLVPALAIAGFAAGAREAVASLAPPEVWTARQLELITTSAFWAKMGAYGLVVAFLAGIGILELRRRLSRSVTIRYTGHGEISGRIGPTLLEISRLNSIPHPSTCGGRGRCSSCRVLVMEGAETLPPPQSVERRLLDRIQAPRNVRLACQIRPTKPLQVRIIMAGQSETSVGFDSGGARAGDATVLVCDIRAFSYLARTQLPGDAVLLLNRMLDDLVQATVAHGGQVGAIQTDGIMAAFGIDGDPKSGALAALNCAADMLTATEAANLQFASALPIPLRLGIGIHSGPVVIATRGIVDGSSDATQTGQPLAVIGETVVVAGRLEEATKEVSADCLVSQAVYEVAGLPRPQAPVRQINYKRGDKPITAYAVNSPRAVELPAAAGRREKA
jgi:adenylate cyclase